MEVKKVCGYIRTTMSPKNDPEFEKRKEFLESVIALHEDWDCVDIVVERSTRSSVDRPVLTDIVERMEKGELKYIVVTHLGVIHANVSIQRKFIAKLKTMNCGVVSIYERLNTLTMELKF